VSEEKKTKKFLQRYYYHACRILLVFANSKSGPKPVIPTWTLISQMHVPKTVVVAGIAQATNQSTLSTKKWLAKDASQWLRLLQDPRDGVSQDQALRGFCRGFLEDIQRAATTCTKLVFEQNSSWLWKENSKRWLHAFRFEKEMGNFRKSDPNNLRRKLKGLEWNKHNAPASVQVSVHFCSDAEIQELNKEHMGRDEPTDVLSFAETLGNDEGKLQQPIILEGPSVNKLFESNNDLTEEEMNRIIAEVMREDESEIEDVELVQLHTLTGQREPRVRPSRNLNLGEIFISLERACAQADERIAENRVPASYTAGEELRLLFIHGLLHIFGFDHEERSDLLEMQQAEQLLNTRLAWGISASLIDERTK